MSRKPTKLIGLSLKDFERIASRQAENISKKTEIHLQPARLIPLSKPGDEVTLTSIFLAGLHLVNEFRTQIFSTIELKRSNQILYFTEPNFILFDNHRKPDGLILVVRSKKIIDAVLIEVKNKNANLDDGQIKAYLNIAKDYGIPKLLTISNQFVSFPTQSPVDVKTSKQVSTYHLSWSYILTLAHILKEDNENNIADLDQVEIMKEILKYFESPVSGVVGFTQMKKGWTELTDKVTAETRLKASDKCVEEAVSSWLQEERDMALILSRKLGLIVKSGQRKYKNDLSKRVDFEKKELVRNGRLESSLLVDGAVAPLLVHANFRFKTIKMSTTVFAPLDKKMRGQVTWILNQLKRCEKKDIELFGQVKPNLKIEVNLKFKKDPVDLKFDDLESTYDDIGNREIKSFNVVCYKSLGRKFKSTKGVVTIIETMLIEYYQGVVQHLKRWEKPAPQIVKSKDPGEVI